MSKLKSVPHCDCRKANLAYSTAYQSVYQMVPTKTDEHGYCLHCGHVAPLLIPNIVNGVTMGIPGTALVNEEFFRHSRTAQGRV